jgi:hypothetical protein
MKTRSRKVKRGGGYGFGGSILSDAGGAGAGNALWSPDTSKDCGSGQSRPGNSGGSRRRRRGGMQTNESLASRGNNNTGGKRRRRRHRTRRGGALTEQQLRAYQLGSVVQAPRTGYGFDGEGVAGTANTIPYQ